MKRHPSFQPLSRDHNVSLVLARRLEREPVTSTFSDFLQVWKDELEDHFFEEERILLQFATPEQCTRLLNEHMTVRQYVDAGRRGMLATGDIVRLGRCLHDHIRWEERRLFPEMEAALGEDELAAIGVETARLEERRADSVHAPRRGDLSQRQGAGEREPNASNPR